MTPGAFLPHHALVRADGASPARWAVVLHGVFGSGANWRLFATRLARSLPDWGFVLVDLRGHGASQHAPPPHTVRAAADDVLRLEASLGLRVDAIVGHSFGGKVALTMCGIRPAPVHAAFVLDSTPGARGPTGGTLDVLAFLQSVPQPLPSRERFVELALATMDRATADWIAMHVRPAADGFRIRLDLAAIGDLLADYFATDLWPVLEEGRGAHHHHVVVGGRSDVVTAADRARLETLEATTAGRLRLHVLDKAAHWVHVDDPTGLHDVLVAGLSSRAGSD